MTNPLGPSDVHLRYAYPDLAAEELHSERLLSVLSGEERSRQRRFVFPADRHLYLVAHALVRVVLSSYTGVDPADWLFASNGYGKPEVAAPAEFRDLRFNLSHTTGLAVCAVTRGRAVGVDAECLDRRVGSPGSLANYLSREEELRLGRLPASERAAAFLETWTLKEAYLKCVGVGLSMPLTAFAVQPDDRGGASVRFTPATLDDPARIQFKRFGVGTGHIVATAVRREPGEELAVSLREAEPLW